jgi:hypothetical protein
VAALAPEPQASAPALPIARPRPRVRAERRIRVASGVVWIVIIAALLAGVVFMNVAVLRLNLKLDKLARERAQLQADVAAQASDLSSEQAAARIALLSRRAGFVQAPPGDISYLDLKP